MLFDAKKKSKRQKKNNPHNVPNDKANEIRGLSNDDLLNRLSLEYSNWIASEQNKKDDPEIRKVKEQLKDLSEQAKEDPQYIEMEAKLKEKLEDILGEDGARFKEELKNLVQPYSEDIKLFKGMFKVAIEEMGKRKKEGLMK